MSLLKNKVNKLLTQFKSGNEKAYAELYELIFYRIYGIAWDYLKNKDDCDDVIEESLLDVWVKIEMFDPEKDGYNWICKIVENKSKDRLRSIKSHQRGCEQKDTRDEFDLVETKCDIAILLEKLDEWEYQLIYERYFLDKSLYDISLQTGQSVKQVSVKIKKILKKLRKNGKKHWVES